MKDDNRWGLAAGRPQYSHSVGPMVFGPDEVLFVADNRRAAIVALDVADTGPDGSDEPFDLEGLDTKLASLLGCGVQEVFIRDLAVHPRTNNVFLSVMRGAGDDAIPAIVRVDRLNGRIEALELEGMLHSEVILDDAPAADDDRLDTILAEKNEAEEMEHEGQIFRVLRLPVRTATITDMQFVDGSLFVAGLSNEEFASTLRRISFPFSDDATACSLEIFHVSHGQWETAAPIRTFAPYQGGAGIVASYTCTPLVHFPLADLRPGRHVRGRTVAELGFGNTPLDIVAISQGGEEHLLISNSRRPLIKVSCRDIDGQDGLTQPKEPVGVVPELPDLDGIGRMDRLNDEYVLAVQWDDQGGRHLRSLKTASL